jgi:F-type H+-transporting ATPase subunit gamma
MANLRDIRRRIGSVKNTKQITSAMKLVAGAKLRKATEKALAARPYQDALSGVLQSVGGRAGDVSNPLLESHETVTKAVVVVFGSDKGLCGGFNNSLFRSTEKFIKQLEADGYTVTLRTFGKKARGYFGPRGYTVTDATIELDPHAYMDQVHKLADHLVGDFTTGEVDEVYLAFNAFKSVMTQVPSYPKVLPLTLEESESDGDDSASADFAFEPNGQELVNTLLPLYLQGILLQAFLETEAGEHASRMTAMDSASRNASDLIDSLTLQFNRARQAAITTEIIEVVSGAAAL